jgi:transaldolase
LIITPEQALVAAKSGAGYLSPFAGRIDDHLRKKHGMAFGKEDYYKENERMHDNGIYSGVYLVESIRAILDNYGFNSEIIPASLRNPRQVRECALESLRGSSQRET